VLDTDAAHHPDLYWALRGGGGGQFGIVTSLRLRTHPTRPVYVFFLHWPWRQAAAVVRGWQGWAPTAPDALWSNLHDYQRTRIEVFLNPDMDPFGAGYHITQSKLALGLGGFWGQGFMQRMQSPAEFVPEKHTDFIASIIGEEWGFAGLLFLIAIYALLILTMMRMASRCQNRFARLAIAGSAMTFFIYVFINLAMVTGLVPVVGIPLPLVSYGGTSMMTLMVGLGLAMSGYVHGREGGQGANGPF